MKVFYARVSTVDQCEARQIVQAKELGIGPGRIFLDKCSGKDRNRPELKRLMGLMGEGDEVIISSFDRLARSTKDLLEIIEHFNEQGVKVISLKENLNTATPQGKLMVTMFGAIATFERELLLERQREGIAAAKAEGRASGRPKVEKPKNWKELYEGYMNRKIKMKELVEETGVKRGTLYNWIKSEE